MIKCTHTGVQNSVGSRFVTFRYWLQTFTLGISCAHGHSDFCLICLCVCLMVFNATFNNISVISWRSVLLVEETGGPGENLSQVTDKLYHIMLYTSPWSRFELTTSVVIGTDCIGSCKSNYHTITTRTAPDFHLKCHYLLISLLNSLNI
jgi:hypothetical protein